MDDEGGWEGASRPRGRSAKCVAARCRESAPDAEEEDVRFMPHRETIQEARHSPKLEMKDAILGGSDLSPYVVRIDRTQVTLN
jgi:hypothetical protein